MEYHYRGDPELAHLIADIGSARELGVRAHAVPGLGFEYGTLIPMHHMNRDGAARVVSIAVNQYASIDEGRRFGVLGWDAYPGRGELLGDYFGSSGTGQVNVLFDPPAPPAA